MNTYETPKSNVSYCKEAELTIKKRNSDFEKRKIISSMDAAQYIKQFYHDDIEIYESFFVLILNRRNETIAFAKIAQGGVSMVLVDVKIIAKYILDMIYTKSIREEQGGTYGVGVSMAGHRSPQKRALIQVQFDTNPEQAETLCAIAKEQLYKFAQNGPTEEELSMAIENLKKNLPESRINNRYWMSVLDSWDEYGIDYDKEYEDAINSVTAKDVKKLLKKILKQKNMIEFKSMPVSK